MHADRAAATHATRIALAVSNPAAPRPATPTSVTAPPTIARSRTCSLRRSDTAAWSITHQAVASTVRPTNSTASAGVATSRCSARKPAPATPTTARLLTAAAMAASVIAVLSSELGRLRCSGNSATSAISTPSSPAWLQRIIAEIAAAAAPTSAGGYRRAAASHVKKPRLMRMNVPAENATLFRATLFGSIPPRETAWRPSRDNAGP